MRRDRQAFPEARPDPEALARLMGHGLALFCQLVPNGEALWTPSGVAALSGSPEPGYNTAVLWADAGPGDLARLIEFLASRGRFATYLMSPAALDRLAPVAPLYGLVAGGHMPIMTFCPAKAFGPAAGPYRVERLTRWQDIRDEAAPMVIEAFDLPAAAAMAVLSDAATADLGLDVFVARRGPAAMSTVYTTRTGGHVGIWSMATPAAYRRRGAGRAVLEGAMAYHLARGVHSFHLGATVQGIPLYARVGFEATTALGVWSHASPDAPTALVR